MRKRRATGLLAILIALTPGLAAQNSSHRPADGFSFAAAGDLILPVPPPRSTTTTTADPVSRLFLNADLGFANQEGAIFDLATFQGWPEAENGGGTPVSPPEVAARLRSMGITIVSKANNHATDWGAAGLLATLDTLAKAGIAQAGSGPGLLEARAPGYVQTPHGLAALVSTASTFPPMSVAAPASEYRGVPARPRPGISALRVRPVRGLPADQFNELRQTVGNAAYQIGTDDLRIGDTLFRKNGTPTRSWEVEPNDRTAVLDSIREAQTKAQFVLFTIHAHQTAGDADNGPAAYQPEVLHFANEAAAPADPRPADFEPALFHAAIDAGADAVVRTGPHNLNGIEIYKGKPIFYSLGSLYFPFGQRRTFTTAAGETITMPDEYFETVVPVTTYQAGKVSEIRLHPMVIDRTSGPTGGTPQPAAPNQALRILERVRDLSRPFGTNVRIEQGVGVVRP